ncbi:MAG TPA: site-2 protease family protein [Kofleriaceae bacterium]|nr:site-2 protease family protein [Kofleriaceae bacterium]
MSYGSRGGLDAALMATTVVVSTFVFVATHELGHALVARHHGCRTRQILLLPIGGISSLDHMPESPAQELEVALAGPAVNVLFATLLLGFVWLAGGDFGTGAFDHTTPLAAQLAYINVGLALFNLVPAFPMDGGRVLRALLALKLGRARATELASATGKVFAALFVVVGLMVNPMLALIGVFVWLASSQESASVHLHALVAGTSVRKAMITELDPLDAELPIEAAVERMLARGVDISPVVRAGLPIGVVTSEDIAGLLALKGVAARVGTIAHAVPVLAPEDSVEHALDGLDQARDQTALVCDHGTLVGMLTADQVASYAAMRGPRRTIAAWRPHHRD